MPQFCPSCGSSNSRVDAFCIDCGESLATQPGVKDAAGNEPKPTAARAKAKRRPDDATRLQVRIDRLTGRVRSLFFGLLLASLAHTLLSGVRVLDAWEFMNDTGRIFLGVFLSVEVVTTIVAGLGMAFASRRPLLWGISLAVLMTIGCLWSGIWGIVMTVVAWGSTGAMRQLSRLLQLDPENPDWERISGRRTGSARARRRAAR